MSIAPVITESPEIDRFLSGLIESKVLDGNGVRSAWDTYRRESDSGDIADLAEFLIRRGLMTEYQAERALAGDAARLLLGPYLLLEPLGSADFGSVFLAVHRGDRRRFAVKVLPIRSLWKVLGAKKQAARFQSLPAHRAIVPLVDIDTANGSHYLVWLYVEGKTLASILAYSGPLAVPDACRLFAEVADGLAICHGAGMFHGLLKPGAILIGIDGRAAVLDSGLGAIVAENFDGESMLDTISTAHSALGMMDYTAPETIADPSLRNAATDVYNLGCVLYESLAGFPPFAAGNVVDKMIAHQTGAYASLGEANPSIPVELDALIAALLQKSPTNRPTAREMKVEMESIAARFTSAAPSSVPIRRPTRNSGPVEPTGHGAGAATPYKASQIFQSSDGMIDFDICPERQSAETPASHRPNTAKVAHPGSSIPELLLPEGGIIRTLSIPSSLPAPVGPKSVAPRSTSNKNWAPPAPVNWAAMPAARPGRVERPPVVLPPVPQFESPQFGSLLARGLKTLAQFWKPVSDTVQLTIFGAPEIMPGQRVNFLVYVHAPDAYSSVATLCRAMRPDTDLLGAGFLEAPVPRGVEIGIHMALRYAGVAKSLVHITWLGQTQPNTFEMFVPWESPPGLASGVVTAAIGPTIIASIPLHFIIPNRQG